MQPLTTNCDSQEEQGTVETIRELDYNIFDKEGVKLPFSYFYVKSKTKPEILLHNITYTLNINDTANIDFTLGGTNNKELKPLCSRFCDNIIAHFIIPEDIIKNNKTLKNYIKHKRINDQPEENTPKSKEDRILNKVLKEITRFLANNTEIIRELFNKFDIPINKTSIKPTSFKVYKGTIKQFIKISLQDVPLDKVLNIVCNKERIKEFNDNGIFINDIEIIQDYSGTINKKDVIDYLLTKPDFRKEGEETINNNKTEEPIKIIIDNNASVGSNCLTFITNSSFGAVRYNLYNKFAQSIESPNVRDSVGNHYSHWINNQEQILKDNIKKSLDTGILRLEITYYIDNQAITEEYINKHLDYLVYILPPNLIFYNSISKQWSLLLNAIKYNLCVVDLDYNLALFSYSINKLTNNISGFYIKNVNTNKLSNILKLYSFNYPIILVSFKRTPIYYSYAIK